MIQKPLAALEQIPEATQTINTFHVEANWMEKAHTYCRGIGDSETS